MVALTEGATVKYLGHIRARTEFVPHLQLTSEPPLIAIRTLHEK